MRQTTLMTMTIAALAIWTAAPAVAAPLTTAELQKMLPGKTVYLEVTAAGTAGVPGVAIVYYAPDGTVVNRNAKGDILRGTWAIKDDMVCLDWKEQPGNPCTIWDKQGDVTTLIISTTKQVRGKVQKIVDGNPENLK
jgi:hypothetical protein